MSAARRLAAWIFALLLCSCAGTRPSDLGVHGGTLAPCPPTPNCVSSDATDAAQRVEPFLLRVPAAEAWQAARRAVVELPRTQLIRESSEYLHAESTSAIFRFVDDLELQLRATEDQIAVRSASRVGRNDLGVNRRRVETLRAELARQGIVRDATASQ